MNDPVLGLTGESAECFLSVGARRCGGCRGPLSGGQGVMLIINNVQDAILATGYVTIRVMIQKQDLTAAF